MYDDLLTVTILVTNEKIFQLLLSTTKQLDIDRGGVYAVISVNIRLLAVTSSVFKNLILMTLSVVKNILRFQPTAHVCGAGAAL